TPATLRGGADLTPASRKRMNVNEKTSAPEKISELRASRRDFLRASALGLAVPVAGGVLAACSTGEAGTGAETASAVSGTHTGAAHAAAPAAAEKTPESIRARADEMDAMHEKGIKSFPVPTECKGNQILEPRLENGVKMFDLETSIVQW